MFSWKRLCKQQPLYGFGVVHQLQVCEHLVELKGRSVISIIMRFCVLYFEHLHDKGEQAPVKLLQIERPVNDPEVEEESA